jgi:hypothetical protein
MKGKPWVWIYVGMAVFMGGMVAVNLALPSAAKAIVPLFIVLGLAGYGLLVYRAFRPRRTVLEVGAERLLVDEGRGGSFPLSGAAFGLWRMAGVGVTAGTVLHLAGGEQVFRVAGRDHRPASAIPLEAPDVEQADAFLSAADFDALLAALPSWVLAARRDAPATPGPLRIVLMPNPAAGRNAFAMMLPWLGTIVLVSLVGGGLGSLGVDEAILLPVIVAIVVGGLVLTVVRSVRRAAGLEIESADRELRVRDPKKGTVLASAPIPFIRSDRAMVRYTGRGASFEHPVLTLHLSASWQVSLGVYDARFRWRDAVPYVSSPRWIVGAPDWNALLDLLGMRDLAVVQPDAWT